MSDLKVLISDGLEENGRAVLQVAVQVDDRTGILASDLQDMIADYSALIVRGRTKVTAELIKAAVNLKVVGRAGVGVDNIDLESATAGGVIVVNTPLATTQAVAELALGLMLALARTIPHADAASKEGLWLKKELTGIEIDGKTLGVIGMGQIGARVAHLSAALGMGVLGYDAYLDAQEIARRGAQPVSLEQLYASSDFITVHVPLTKDTRHLINTHAFQQMKKGVRLVCTARGGVVDEAALLEGLDNGLVGGAALDVFEQEPPGRSLLVAHPNLIATPHIGAQTQEAQRRAALDIAEEVLAALEDRPLRWKVV